MSSLSTEPSVEKRCRSSLALALLLLAALAAAGCRTLEGERLLREGRPAEVLDRVRPAGARNFRLRALALRALGKPVQARIELRIALSLEERSAAAHRLLGEVEAELGAKGAALEHLQRSLALDRRQPAVRTAVARLLVDRAVLRAGLRQIEEGKQDLRLAGTLEMALAREGEQLLQKLRAGGSARASATCPGLPPALTGAPPRPGRCGLPVESLIEENRRRHLLAACHGPALALRLESAGCLDGALAQWSLLAEEAPADPRWPLQAGRVLLGLGQTGAADLRFTDHIFLSDDRAAAQLVVSQLLLAAARPAQAGARAVEALALARSLDQDLQAIALLQRCGEARQLQEAIRTVLSRRSISEAQLRARIDEALLRTRPR